MIDISHKLSQPGPAPSGNGHALVQSAISHDAAFGYPRDFMENRFVYLVISPRARGLSIGVNLNPMVNCNFNCLYCEVDREQPTDGMRFDVQRMLSELEETLRRAHGGRLLERSRYSRLPQELMEVRHVALSGDGEPTLSEHFTEAVREIKFLRARGKIPFFKIVLLTNSTALDRPKVQEGIRLLTREDEVWAKLDGGTQEYINRLNGASTPIEKILNNILLLALRRPVVIQSLFPAINGQEPPETEIHEYAQRLRELKQDGAEISLVQIYSATRPMQRPACSHLSLKCLSRIAQTVRRETGLRAEVY